MDLTTLPSLLPAIAIIKEFEGCKLKAYQDEGGVWTIGWGTTRISGRPVCASDACSQEEADQWMAAELTSVANVVRAHIKVPVTDNQFCALCSFAYNVGVGAFETSTMLKLLNFSAPAAEVAAEFPKWDHDNGKVVEGLLRRREAEQLLFLS